MSHTVRLHRVLTTRPEKIYRAFLEPDAFASWLPPFGFTCAVHAFDARVGGRNELSFRNFSTGESHSFASVYVELAKDERIVYTTVFADPNLAGEMTTTIVLRNVSMGTKLEIEQKGVPSVIPREGCYLGWQDSLVKLARLVEPEIR